MIRTYISLIALLFPLLLWGQEDIYIGKKYTIFSDTLQEKREYWVHLPDDYAQNTEQTYQVIYLLDGQSFFHSLVGISRTLSSGRGRHLAPSIIVGIVSTDRARDLTPTASAAGRDGNISPDVQLQGGGSEVFSHFLTKELRNSIDNSYRTNGQNMLIGHSYGGLFTLNTFLKHTTLFETYLAIDPSLWWDQGRLTKEAKQLIKQQNFTGKSLYIAVASKKRTDRKDIHLNRVDFLLSDILSQVEGLRLFHKSFPEENHGTVAIPAIYDGIKQLFEK